MMEYIFIVFKVGQDQEIELKVPSNMTAGELLEVAEQAFNIQNIEEKCLHVEPLGRILGREEIFAKEGVYNGSKITLV